MLNILGISMKAGSYYRIRVKATEAMKEAWLKIINEDKEETAKLSFEEAVESSCYRSNDNGYLIAEIEIGLSDEVCNVVFFFNEYRNLDVSVSKEEYQQCLSFINDWKDKIPDNKDFMLGDDEWYLLIPDDVPWKM